VIARVGRWLVGAALLAVAVVGVLSVMPPAEARPPCLCPDVFDPVICSNGMTYSNFCVAGCNGATGCHRTGDI
jgi:hypothetical protein